MGNQLAPPPNLSEDEMESVMGWDVTARAFVQKIRDARRVVVLCGAGMSVSAGIPDFRSPNTGLYSKLARFNLPEPEAMFDIEYFRTNPEPFFALSRELLPTAVQPTPAHYFLKLLSDKGKLLRVYTQNIDTLERQTGIPLDQLVEAHGSFASARCIACKREDDVDRVRACIMDESVPRCASCGGLVKPDITFFGESLPRRFGVLSRQDLPAADLMLVIGTSLKVAPVSELINEVGAFTPRLLLNLELVGERNWSGHGFRFDAADNYRDSALLTTCDRGVAVMARALGWEAELQALLGAGRPLPPADAEADAELLDRMWRGSQPPPGELPPLDVATGLEMDLDVPPAGEYGGRLVAGAEASVALRFTAGGPGVDGLDYVGFFAFGARGEQATPVTRSEGPTAATVALRVPSEPGTYELRYVSVSPLDEDDLVVARDGPFTVVERPADPVDDVAGQMAGLSVGSVGEAGSAGSSGSAGSAGSAGSSGSSGSAGSAGSSGSSGSAGLAGSPPSEE